jgi:hypothetical protein
MNRQQLAKRLRLLQDDMFEIANALEHYGGFDSLYHHHNKELLRAAIMVADWADDIEAALTFHEAKK